jgi:hypothetical protein
MRSQAVGLMLPGGLGNPGAGVAESDGVAMRWAECRYGAITNDVLYQRRVCRLRDASPAFA